MIEPHGQRRPLTRAAALVVATLVGATSFAAPATGRAPLPQGTPAAAVTSLTPEVRESARHDTSPTLTAMEAAWNANAKSGGGAAPRGPQGAPTVRDLGALPRNTAAPGARVGSAAVQSSQPGTADFPDFGVNFEGVGNLDAVLPPDTEGDVGPNHYVQMINLHFAVYSKTGALLLGPLPNNALWSGFGGPCASFNDGDPIVLYDEAANRWMMSQFALGAADGHHQCMAISQTPDPTGAWHRYDFLYHATRINDYPKYGIWPDAYYMTTNEFAPGFVGAGAVAFERDRMLAGLSARMVYFHLGPEFGGLLPADAEGLTPPAGVPNPFVMFDDDSFGFSPTDRLFMWDFHVDWTNPLTSTFGVGATSAPNRFLETAPFDSNLCNYARNCIPQLGTAQRLDAISDRLMYRAAYRNFGTHASIVLNHTVDTTGADRAGVRWYELRSTSSGWTIHQQGTYAPDAENRWMASAAIDVNGNIAIGYSASSATSFPSIRVAGRLAGDPLGQLSQGERVVIAGTGSQTHSAARWGDYSSMSVDPTDGCTFWFTTEYLTATSVADWKTRIASAKFPSCSAGPTGTLTGRVTDAATGNPIAGATVSTGGTATTTDADGRYQLILPVGSYDLTASAYGYANGTATVAITDGGTTTQNFALTPLPTVTVSGTVTDGSGKGYPLYARIEIGGRPGGPIFTNPATGAYSVQLAVNTSYTFTTRAEFPGYQTVVNTVAVGGTNLTHNIAVPVLPSCIAAGYAISFGSPILTQTFSTLALPAGWTVVERTTSGGWRFNDPHPRGNLTGGADGFAIMDSDHFGPGNTQDSDLIPPALDFTGMADPHVRFNSDYRAFSNGFADIDYSLDGGTTWTTVWHQTTVSRRGPTVETVGLTGAGGHANVLVRFHYRGTFAWWWEVDNVELVNRSCNPLPGGLVVGVTSDFNTGAGLNGVTVTSNDRPTDKAVSAATPDDPNLSDGFYWLFSNLTGPHPFTAAKPPYVPQTETVDVANNGTRRQDFALRAGRVTVNPGALTVSVPWNGAASRTVTLSNTGSAPATVDLLERTGAFEILDNTGAKLVMQRVKGNVSKGMTGTPSDEITGPSPSIDDSWTTIAPYPAAVLDNSAVVHDGKVYSVGGATGTVNNNLARVYDPIENTWASLANLPVGRAKPGVAAVDGKLYVFGGWGSSGVPVNTVAVFDIVAGTWSTLAGVTNPSPNAAPGVAVADGKIYLVGGCPTSACTAASSSTVVFDPATSSFSTAANYPHPVTWASCGGISGTVYCGGGVDVASFRDGHKYNPASDSWSALPDMPLDLWGSAHSSASGLLVVSGGVTANFSTVTNRSVAYDPATNTWINLPNAQFARYRSGGACGHFKVGGASGGFTGTADSERLGGLDQCDVATDVPWFSASPTSVTLQPGQSQVVTVAFTALGLDQPGTYTAQLGVSTDTPYPVNPVDLTMNVAAPKNWGKLVGTVRGQPCTGAPVPLGAVVRIRSVSDPSNTIVIRTNNQGGYARWMPSGRYDIIVSANGWSPDTRRVSIGSGGKVTTANFTLNPINPCGAGAAQ